MDADRGELSPRLRDGASQVAIEAPVDDLRTQLRSSGSASYSVMFPGIDREEWQEWP
jgi:hypothetical protein